MQARYYDPAIGRFLSTDPVTFSPDKPQQFNRYWYANGNPYKYTDPFGEEGYLVSRPLSFTDLASHNFVVSHAEYVGDPNAKVYSYGKTNEGKTGRVDEGTKGFSEGTSESDKNFWISTQ